MWPFGTSKTDSVEEMEQCEHPEFEEEDDEMIHPDTIYAEDGEIFVNRVRFERRSCTECSYEEASGEIEERVYLNIDRVEGVE